MKHQKSYWKENPLFIGSIYIEPTEEKITCCQKCFQYIYYYCCFCNRF